MSQRPGMRAMNAQDTEQKVGPERTESSKGQNTCRGGPGGSGPGRGAWKNKGGYPRKPAFKNNPKEGLHPAGTSKNKNVLWIGMEVLALKRPPLYQSLSHCPGNESLQRESTLHDTTGRTNEPENWAQVSSTAQLWVPCLGKWIQHPFWSPLFSSLCWRRLRTENDSDRENRSSSALAPCGCNNEIPQALWLKQHTRSFLCFWKSEVQEEAEGS